MIDEHAKAHLHDHLCWVREALVWKLDGLSEYDTRRPLTPTGTNLLGLVKHNAISDARYFGDVFHRPFPEPLPRWDDPAADFVDHWATEHESVRLASLGSWPAFHGPGALALSVLVGWAG